VTFTLVKQDQRNGCHAKEAVTAFKIPQIELIDLLSKSYDGAILNLGMKPEFLPHQFFFL
jgi:hypothetical protein